MVKDMLDILPRKCSFCGHVGHNSRTCNDKASLAITNNGFKAHSVKIFGVNINQEKASSDSIKKSQSMGNLLARENHNEDEDDNASSDDDDRSGYLSDGLIHNKRRKAAHERKKGTPWTEEEHRTFLMGLKNLGKGDWRGISTKYVITRTPTQVASHAQKYFIRQNAGERRKRRSSLFDMTFPPEDLSNSPSPLIRSGAEHPQSSSGSQLHPGNSSMELVQRFPHLCLDKFPLPICPSSNYQPQLYAYSMGAPANLELWPVNSNYGAPSYLCNNRATNSPINNKNDYIEFGSILAHHHHHPSGIPMPGQAKTEKAENDGLELSIAPPQPRPDSKPISSSPGAINVTDNSVFVVAL